MPPFGGSVGGEVGLENDCSDNSCHCCRNSVSDYQMNSLMCGPDVFLVGDITAHFICFIVVPGGRHNS